MYIQINVIKIVSMKKKEAQFKPKSYQENHENISKYSDDEIEKAKGIVLDEEEKKTSKLTKVSSIWALISTVYAIISTCVFIANDWVDDTFSKVLLVMLIVYIIIFFVLIGLTVKDPKKAKKSISTYKKLLKIFKSFANVVFVVLSAVSMAGIANGGMGVKEWVVFVVTFVVAIVQLGFKVSLFVLKIIRKNISKKYKVKVERFVDGEKKKKNAVDTIEEKVFK